MEKFRNILIHLWSQDIADPSFLFTSWCSFGVQRVFLVSLLLSGTVHAKVLWMCEMIFWVLFNSPFHGVVHFHLWSILYLLHLTLTYHNNKSHMWVILMWYFNKKISENEKTFWHLQDVIINFQNVKVTASSCLNNCLNMCINIS